MKSPLTGKLLAGFLRKAIIFVGTIVSCYTLWNTLSLGSNAGRVLEQSRAFYTGDIRRWNDALKVANKEAVLSPHLADSSSKNSDLTNGSMPWSYLRDLSVAYKKKWVGFPQILGSDCQRAFNQSTRNNSVYPTKVKRIFAGQYIADTEDCQVFNEKYGFQRYPEISEEEKEFPIAFTILFYKDLDQVLFLLRAIYRPHNAYCLTVDSKSSIEFLQAIKSVAQCLPNVLVARKLEPIVYSGFTRLMADLDCMEDLLQHPVQWKYVINLPGQQFPLRTNLELVNILKLYNGANDVEGITGNRMLSTRFKWKHKYERDNKTGELKLVRTSESNPPPPHKIDIVKGSAYGSFSRAFVQFVVHNPQVRDFLEWLRDVSSPDEYFWATVHHSKTLKAPGGYTAGQPDKKPWLSTYASWGGRDPCATVRTRSVCIFSPEDLPLMMKKHELFANKFYITHHPAALHCLDEMLLNLTFSGKTRDLSFYKNLPFALKSNDTNSAKGG